MSLDQIQIKVDLLFGHVEVQTRQAPGPDNTLLFQGRRLRYDGSGSLVETTEWETNLTVSFGNPPA